MMIFKYDLEPLDVQTIQMPKGAEILSAIQERGRVRIFATANPKMPNESRVIESIGTHTPCDDARRDYLGTIQQGSLFGELHIFERHA